MCDECDEALVRAAEEAGEAEEASGGANDDVAAGEGFTEDSNKLGRGSEGSEGSDGGQRIHLESGGFGATGEFLRRV